MQTKETPTSEPKIRAAMLRQYDDTFTFDFGSGASFLQYNQKISSVKQKH